MNAYTHTHTHLYQKLCCHSTRSFCMTLNFPWERPLLTATTFPSRAHKCQKRLTFFFLFFFEWFKVMVWKEIENGKGWDGAFMLWWLIIWSWLQISNRLPVFFLSFFFPHPPHSLFFSVQAVNPANPTPAIPQAFCSHELHLQLIY